VLLEGVSQLLVEMRPAFENRDHERGRVRRYRENASRMRIGPFVVTHDSDSDTRFTQVNDGVKTHTRAF